MKRENNGLDQRHKSFSKYKSTKFYKANGMTINIFEMFKRVAKTTHISSRDQIKKTVSVIWGWIESVLNFKIDFTEKKKKEYDKQLKILSYFSFAVYK